MSEPANGDARVFEPSTSALRAPNATQQMNDGEESWARPSANDRRDIVPLFRVGEPSTFSTSPWWDRDQRRWWGLAEGGFSNDVVCDVGTIGELAVAAAALRGAKHRLTGEGGQDAFFLGATKEVLVAAIGDGVSSSQHAAYASRRATQLVVTQLCSELRARPSLDPSTWKREIQRSISATSQQMASWQMLDFGAPPGSSDGVEIAQLCTTLTVAVVPLHGTKGSRQSLVAWIGDSPAFLLRSQRWAKLSTAHEADGPLVDPRTQCLPETTIATYETVTVRDGEALFLMSDGLGGFLITGDGTHLPLGDYLARHWVEPVDMISFLGHANVDFRTADDDRTVVAIWAGRSEP
jgi:serine/threonine protein phosphatase PrpC